MYNNITSGNSGYYYIDPWMWNATTATSTFRYTTTQNMDTSKYWNMPIEYTDPTEMDIDKDGEVAMDKFLDDLCGPST